MSFRPVQPHPNETATMCTQCSGTGFWCKHIENGKPFSTTGFDCYHCGGSGWCERKPRGKRLHVNFVLTRALQLSDGTYEAQVTAEVLRGRDFIDSQDLRMNFKTTDPYQAIEWGKRALTTSIMEEFGS